jgi:hypothetical protein
MMFLNCEWPAIGTFVDGGAAGASTFGRVRTQAL